MPSLRAGEKQKPMQDLVTVTGIVIKSQPVGESDRRVTILTNSRGKVGAFARGARKQGSRFAASTGPFAFGTFQLYEGRDSYTIADARIENYFEELRTDMEAMALASYFAEIADYYCRENNDEREMMKLLYQSLRALFAEKLGRRLVRRVFELKALAIEGEYPGPPTDRQILPGTVQAMNYIGESPVERLYTFTLSEAALSELEAISDLYCKRYMEHHFRSLEILETLLD